tara:strand:- start:19587 stop:19982 length:396 start_codon:yes stop_codon:yes gene_type:complete
MLLGKYLRKLYIFNKKTTQLDARCLIVDSKSIKEHMSTFDNLKLTSKISPAPAELIGFTQNEPPSDFQCPICLEGTEVHNRLCQGDCGHVFHTKCIYAVYIRHIQDLNIAEDVKCPMCRDPFVLNCRMHVQ